MSEECAVCRGAQADRELSRTQVWGDALWRVSTSIAGDPVAGLSYLEPRRHVTALDGREAATYGDTLSRCSTVLREVTGAELVYVQVLGRAAGHLRVRLSPHAPGDAWDDRLLPGRLDGSEGQRALPDEILRITAAQLRGAFLHTRSRAQPPPPCAARPARRPAPTPPAPARSR